MSDIDIKSFGMLMDELSIVNIKCFMAQEIICSSNDPHKIAAASKSAQSLNARRNALINAIDKRKGESNITTTQKTYE